MHIDAKRLAHSLAWALAPLLLSTACGDDSGGGSAWDPADTDPPTATLGGGDSSSGGPSDDTTSGGDDDGTTTDAGESGDEPTTGDPTDPTTGDSGEPITEVCFPGEDGSYATCFDLVAFDTPPEGYTYPAPLNGQDSYRPPIAFIDLEGVDPTIKLAPNFQLSEIAQADQGRYAIIQPHAIESLQMLRDMLGSINVNAGYRPPGHDVGTEGSDPYSRHLYGDGFDLVPTESSVGQLATACTDIGGVLVESGSYAHCDFRNDPLDEGFFGAAGG